MEAPAISAVRRNAVKLHFQKSRGPGNSFFDGRAGRAERESGTSNRSWRGERIRLFGLPVQSSLPLMKTARHTWRVERWGLVPYAESVERQHVLVEKRKRNEIADTLVFVEHPPVYTIGARHHAEEHLLWDAPTVEAAGIEVHRSSRGGDITYHGPGQLVGYAVIDLRERRDLHAYLRNLEEVLIEAVDAFGLKAGRRPGMTGIWCGDRKIAAIGVAVRSWITYHGFALNIEPNLEHFTGIVPCGIASTDGTVTSMERELGTAPVWQAVEIAVIRAFRSVFFG